MECRHFYLYTVQKYKCTKNNSVYYLFILYEVLLDLDHKYLFPYYTLYYNNSKRYVLYILKDEGKSVEENHGIYLVRTWSTLANQIRDSSIQSFANMFINIDEIFLIKSVMDKTQCV